MVLYIIVDCLMTLFDNTDKNIKLQFLISTIYYINKYNTSSSPQPLLLPHPLKIPHITNSISYTVATTPSKSCFCLGGVGIGCDYISWSAWLYLIGELFSGYLFGDMNDIHYRTSSTSSKIKYLVFSRILCFNSLQCTEMSLY